MTRSMLLNLWCQMEVEKTSATIMTDSTIKSDTSRVTVCAQLKSLVSTG